MEQRVGRKRRHGLPLQVSRRTWGRSQQPPVFKLAGLAIGDGLTDPLTQVEIPLGFFPKVLSRLEEVSL